MSSTSDTLVTQLDVVMNGAEETSLKKRKLDASESEGTVSPPAVSVGTKLLIKRLSDKARIPTRGSAHAAGYDLYRCVSSYFLPSFSFMDNLY